MSESARLRALQTRLRNLLEGEEASNDLPTKLENLIRYAWDEATEQLRRANEPKPDEQERDEVHVVVQEHGEYSDRTVTLVAAFRDLVKAQEYVVGADAWAGEQYHLYREAGHPDDDPRWPFDDEMFGNAATHPEYGMIDIGSGYAYRHHVETIEVRGPVASAPSRLEAHDG